MGCDHTGGVQNQKYKHTGDPANLFFACAGLGMSGNVRFVCPSLSDLTVRVGSGV